MEATRRAQQAKAFRATNLVCCVVAGFGHSGIRIRIAEVDEGLGWVLAAALPARVPHTLIFGSQVNLNGNWR